MGEVINDLCGGLKPGRSLKAIIPGGSSAKVLKADEKYKLKDAVKAHQDLEGRNTTGSTILVP